MAVFSAPTALIESIIQINKAYKYAFLSIKMLFRLKLPGLRPDSVGEAFRAPLNSLADVIGCISYMVLYSL